MAAEQLNVVLCWHMHQPFYREGLDGDFRLPWVYLHGLKDYTDMAAHLEQHPAMHAVVDFAPVLLEQIDIYAQQLSDWLTRGAVMADPLLNLLAGATEIPRDATARQQLIADCKRCNPATMVEPYPAFSRLMSWTRHCDPDAHDEAHFDAGQVPLEYLSEAYFVDLLVWYHLAWTGYSLRQHKTIQGLMAQQTGFSLADRRALVEVIHDALSGIIPRYRALAERGQIELAMTPYAHPIVPLLNDFENMRCALPDAPGPDAERYPGGTDRSRWHMQRGIEVFEQYFGHRPQGVWLSEGGVSADALAVLDEFDIKWTASGEGVWANCCQHLPGDASSSDSSEEDLRRSLFQPYRFKQGRTSLFFRDDGLSDMIGFEYQHWDAQDAAANFCHNLENIARYLGDSAGEHVVSIILDGENAWEHYSDNAHHFLDALYQCLSYSALFKMTTFSEMAQGLPAKRIDKLCPGSWIYGSFSTWIGEKDKNAAWEALVEAKLAYDEVFVGGALDEQQKQRATAQLAICESSDWFWWFGDYNPADSVRDFDQMYRRHLSSLYELLQLTPPSRLKTPFSGGNTQAIVDGSMRRAS